MRAARLEYIATTRTGTDEPHPTVAPARVIRTHTLGVLLAYTLGVLLGLWLIKSLRPESYMHTLGVLLAYTLGVLLGRATHPRSAPASIHLRQHTSAYVSIGQHPPTSAYVRIRQHTSTHPRSEPANIHLRQHTSAYVSIGQHPPTSAYVRIRQHTSASTYVSIRQHTSTHPRSAPASIHHSATVCACCASLTLAARCRNTARVSWQHRGLVRSIEV